ncbi:MAG: hypothetical protein AB1486_29370 [Planctomycetota bacterium]
MVLLVTYAVQNRPIVLAVFTVLSLHSAITLYRHNETWRIAGALCRTIIADVAQHCPADRLVVINVPDNIRGVHVFRNGFALGVLLWGKAHYKRLNLVAQNSLSSTTDTTLVRGSNGTYRVRLPNPATSFVRFTDQKSITPAVVSEVRESSFCISVGPLGPNDRVLYYSAGRMLRVEP